MISGRGTYFDGCSSTPVPVLLGTAKEGLRYSRDGKRSVLVPLDQLTIEPALGQTRRRIRLKAGGLIETDTQALVTHLEGEQGSNIGLRLVHWMEQRWRMALLSLVGLAAACFLFLTYGLPVLSDKAARSIPLAATTPLTDRTLAMLDEHVFAPSELPEADAQRLQRLFTQLHTEHLPETPCRLVFRQGQDIGANAFAFPDGLIVMTDELVAMADNDRQIAGVLLHEMAHVANRHSLRSTFQSAGVFVLISILTGDVTATTSLAASLPTVLLESGYSREFEEEADREAGRFMIERGWGTTDFQAMLKKLSGESDESLAMAQYLSTHPVTAERIAKMKQLEASAQP